MRPRVAGKLQTILESYPEYAISLIRQQDAKNLDIVNDDYKYYLESISSVQEASNLLVSGKKFLKHEVLTSEDRHPSYHLKSTLHCLGNDSLKMGLLLK